MGAWAGDCSCEVSTVTLALAYVLLSPGWQCPCLLWLMAGNLGQCRCPQMTLCIVTLCLAQSHIIACVFPPALSLPSLSHFHPGPLHSFITVYLLSDLIDVFEEQTSIFCKKDAVGCFPRSDALWDGLLVTHNSSCRFSPEHGRAFQSSQAAV